MISLYRFQLDRRLLWLLLFSFTDAAFTHLGISFKLVEELNPLIRHLYDWNISGYYAYKLLFPMLLAVLYPHIQDRRWFAFCLTATVWLYGAVNLYHLAWISYCLKFGYF